MFKTQIPLDQHSIRKEITPPQSSDKDNDILICLLQKLINEITKCQVPVSLKNNSFEIKLPNYIIKVDLNYHEQQDHLYPLQYSIHAWHRDFQYLEISNTFMIPSLNDLIFHIQKLFYLYFNYLNISSETRIFIESILFLLAMPYKRLNGHLKHLIVRCRAPP